MAELPDHMKFNVQTAKARFAKVRADYAQVGRLPGLGFKWNMEEEYVWGSEEMWKGLGGVSFDEQREGDGVRR